MVVKDLPGQLTKRRVFRAVVIYTINEEDHLKAQHN